MCVVNVRLEPFQPSEPAEFWCHTCDLILVDSTDLLTGSFFVVDGHKWDRDSRQYDGEWVMVMFAVCNGCLKTRKSDQ